MKKSLVWLVLAVGGCSYPETQMVVCPASGCATEAVDAIQAEMNQRATADLQCPVSEIQFTDLGTHWSTRGYRFEARGCGRVTAYTYDEPWVERTAPVTKSAF